MNAKLFSFKTLALFLVATMLLLSNGFSQNKSQLSACEEHHQAKAVEAQTAKGKSAD
jgi:hypothetical protein